MPRVSQPKPSEPIRLITTQAGPRYRVTLDVSQPGEKRRQVTSTHPTLKAARAHVLEVRSAISRGTYTAPNSETLRALCERWLASRTDVRQVTREGYAAVLVPVLKRLGDRRVQSLKVGDLDELFAWLAAEGSKAGKPLKPRTIQLARTCLVMALDLAVRENVIPSNPARLARRPRTRAVVGTDLKHWTPEQVRTFVAQADSHDWAACWRLSACGLTRADLCGLRWSDLDLLAGTATISQGRTALASGASLVDDPKSQQRRRTIPFETIWPGTTARLKILRAQQAADKLAAGEAWTESGLVLVDGIGRGVAPQVYSDHFQRIVTAAGLPRITLHELRHSLAFWLHSAEVAPRDASALLGHTVTVHLDSYLPAGGTSGITAAAKALAVTAG